VEDEGGDGDTNGTKEENRFVAVGEPIERSEKVERGVEVVGELVEVGNAEVVEGGNLAVGEFPQGAVVDAVVEVESFELPESVEDDCAGSGEKEGKIEVKRPPMLELGFEFGYK